MHFYIFLAQEFSEISEEKRNEKEDDDEKYVVTLEDCFPNCFYKK